MANLSEIYVRIGSVVDFLYRRSRKMRSIAPLSHKRQRSEVRFDTVKYPLGAIAPDGYFNAKIIKI